MENYEAERWQLDELFPGFDTPEFEQAVADLKDRAAAFAGTRDELSPELSADRFLGLVQAYEELSLLANRLYAYGALRFSEDTQDQKAQSAMAQIQQLLAELDNQTMFFTLWWKTLPDEAAERLLAAAGDFHYWLESLRRQRPHTLSEPEEKIINIKNVNGPSALETLYDSITNRYIFRLEIDGEERELTRGELQVYFRNADADKRAAAYRELYRVYGADSPILGQIYQFRVRDWRAEHVGLRDYDSPIAVRNLANDIPDDVVETLLDVTRKNTHLFHRFFKLKARWLGMEKLRRYDVYAPVAQADREYSYNTAVELVLESFRKFEPRVEHLARRVFNEHHLDGEIRKGKQSGAFCASFDPNLTPYVLQSFQKRADDVATMAHELGHAIHSMLASDHNSLVFHASLPLAETASTFAEMLLIDHLLESDPDPELQRDLLFRQMDDAYATILRQTYFAIFEKDAHAAIASGASTDELSTLYLENLRDQFGDSLELSEDFQHEWVAIPHIYATPFYVYAYAFGQLLVLSLYQQYREEGESFKPRYLDILAAGGSAAPTEVLEKAGIDISDPGFWQGGFDVIAGLLDRLERLEMPAPAS